MREYYCSNYGAKQISDYIGLSYVVFRVKYSYDHT